MFAENTDYGASADDPAEVIVNIARRLDKGGYLLSQVGLLPYLELVKVQLICQSIAGNPVRSDWYRLQRDTVPAATGRRHRLRARCP